MKKIYKAPMARAIEINAEELIADSPVPLSDDPADENYEGGGDVKEETNSFGNLW